MNLSDLTFVIPVGIESEDRLRNFLFTYSYIKKICPDANVIIHEMGDINHCTNINDNNTLKLFTQTEKNSGIFYKTWCINRALEYVPTKVVCIYDVDVILSRETIEQSTHAILNGYDMILPFTCGNYQKQILNFEECKKFFETLNFNDFTQTQLNAAYYGHVQFFNTDSYLNVGGENEEIHGWGPEDQEKLYKMQALGYKVAYLPETYVWHIEHSRVNPQYWLTELHEKNMQIFQNIKNMNDEQRKEYYSKQAEKIKKKVQNVS